MPKTKLRLSPAAIRRIEKKHSIKNLLVMKDEDTDKLTLDFFVDFTVEGSSHQADPPSAESLEESADLKELIANVKDYLGNG